MYNINPPDPSRLIHGLRDTGYNINSAAADIIDNSIAADAENVHVRTVLKPNGAKIIYFGDDGHGMNKEGLRNAMRYGADKRENLKSLGKFGLGLKTASSFVCLKYSLISRDKSEGELHKQTWDLEHVADVNDWEMVDEGISHEDELAFEELCGETGTLLVWEKCDRVIKNNSYDPGSSEEKAALKRVAGRMTEHFALVFHKYLDSSEDRFRNVNIMVDGNPVEYWNPFYPQRSEQVLPEKLQRVDVAVPENPDQTFPVLIKAWVLPHRKDMEKEEEQKYAKITNRRQGFYIYREGRLIDHGNWQGIWIAADPHFSLIRVEMEFTFDLDDAFEIDVRKSRIIMNEALTEYLEELLRAPREHANKVYRRKQTSSVTEGIDHTGSNRTITSTKRVAKPSVGSSNPDTNESTVTNNRGEGIRIVAPVLNNQDPKTLSVSESESIVSGDLWEPSFVSDSNTEHQVGVRINKHHDFYSKIYTRAGGQDSVEGMDLLLYALAAAELNNSDDELKDIWDDIRSEVSGNLKKLLKSYDIPADCSNAQ